MAESSRTASGSMGTRSESSSLELEETDSTSLPLSPSSAQKSESTSRRSKKTKSSRVEKIVLVFLVGFVINGINGRKLMKDVRSQFDQFTEMVYNSTPAEAQQKSEDTAIVITSSWIPSHPSTYMVEMVVNSTVNLVGLSPTAPIFVTIDFFRFTDFAGQDPKLNDKVNNLDEYAFNLMSLYLDNPRIHILPAVKRYHIGGSVMRAMKLIEKLYPTVRYLYYLQHDFYFFREVDHTALVNVMDKYPDKINYIRFPKRAPHTISRQCGFEKAIVYNETEGFSNETKELHLSPTSAYSDNNHLVRLPWYKDVIASLIKLDRAPEDPLQSRANNGCRTDNTTRRDDIKGLYLYHEMNIGHLDGRHRSQTP